MENLNFAAIALFILLFGAISGRISKTAVTPPMVFVAFGFLLGPNGTGLIDADIENSMVQLAAEITLVLVLFTDACHVDLRRLRTDHQIPVRLLSCGLPLCMLTGSLIAVLIFPQFGIWEAVILAVMLAPTDAALGQAVVSSPVVPIRIRQALNVESGLNDGLALPVLLLFVCWAGAADQGHAADNWLKLAAMQVLFGTAVGLAVGYGGGKLVTRGTESGWMTKSFEDLSAIGLSLFAFAFAELISGNGFIAAFCAGSMLGHVAKKSVRERVASFGEAEGQLLTLITFLLFGAIMVPPALEGFRWTWLWYALLSLTAVRMIPVFLALLGLKLRPMTTLFLGWFGPRGIASILYGLLVIEEADFAAREEIFHIAMLTVLLSVVLHGFSAWPGAKWYAAHMSHRKEAIEHIPSGKGTT